jgi:EAL and modified HD-GYP domain-containing signal transduction protein
VAIAREPILDRRQAVFAYALRLTAPGGARPRDAAAEAALDNAAVAAVGLDAAANGHPAFVPVSRDLLLEGLPPSLPASHVVVELPGDIEADADVVRACEQLRDRGYALAIDDFVLSEGTSPLVALARYLKIDTRRGDDADARARTVACLRPSGAEMIATGVETFEEFEAAVRDGFLYCQGFCFGRPTILPDANAIGRQAATLRLLRALNDSRLSIGALEEMVNHDAGLCYRILRTVNSAAFGIPRTVESMSEALMLVGREAVRRWASMWAVAGLAAGAPSETVVLATVRARACELLASRATAEDLGSDAFLLGMCSLLDVMLGRAMPGIVAELPLADETRQALCGAVNARRRLLETVIACERGDWAIAATIARPLGIDPSAFPAAVAESLRWAREMIRPGDGPDPAGH